ncbi:MAG: DUF2325 domain-containing protein [Candidatus Thiodiazotropha sp.]
MCQLPAPTGVTRLLFESDARHNRVRILDPDTGSLLLETHAEDQTTVLSSALPTEAQRELLDLADRVSERLYCIDFSYPDEAPDTPRPPGPRRKLWELNGSYHCPVIGTCASVSELRKVARQAQLQSEKRLSDYEIHSSFVTLAGERCPASRQLHKLLDRKYASAIKSFSQARDDTSLRQLWREFRDKGQIAGALWALMTHPSTSDALTREAYEEIHMLSHQIGASNRVDIKQLHALSQEVHTLKQQLARNTQKSAQTLAEKNQRIMDLKEQLAAGHEARQRLFHLESGETIQGYQKRIEDLERKLAESLARAQQTERLQLRQQQGKGAPDRDDDRVPNTINPGEVACTACDQAGACPAIISPVDLSGCCVLCVGGRTGAADHYRRLVEQNNGSFLHHDGGLEDSRQQLSVLLERADAVLCPADHVSHDAALRVKRYCKHAGKRCLFLRTAGKRSFAEALSQLTHPKERAECV